MHLTDALLRSINFKRTRIIVARRIQEFLSVSDRWDKTFSRTKARCPSTIGVLTIFVHCSLNMIIWSALIGRSLTRYERPLCLWKWTEIEFRVLTAAEFVKKKTIGCEHSGSATCRPPRYSQVHQPAVKSFELMWTIIWKNCKW